MSITSLPAPTQNVAQQKSVQNIYHDEMSVLLRANPDLTVKDASAQVAHRYNVRPVTVQAGYYAVRAQRGTCPEDAGPTCFVSQARRNIEQGIDVIDLTLANAEDQIERAKENFKQAKRELLPQKRQLQRKLKNW